MDYNPGDVIRVNLGETVGHEQEGERPCVVISHSKDLGLIVIIPLTSKEKFWPTVVSVEKDEGGLPKKSFALCHQIRSISEERINEKIGALSSETMNKIRTTLSSVVFPKESSCTLPSTLPPTSS
jgi:mRNA interferase MazF